MKVDKKWFAIFAISFVMAGGNAANANLVTNGSFETTTSFNGFAQRFSDSGVTGWTGGDGLTYLIADGQADKVHDPVYRVYGPFPAHSPDGGNFVQSDGDRTYGYSISQSISGLTVGEDYLLTFYQAAGQAYGYTGATTEAWDVTFGGVTQRSSTFSIPEAGVGPWELQTMTFTASTATQVLTFYAYGTPNGVPPTVFLDGVLLNAVPEPSSLALSALGLLGFGALRWRRRRNASVA